MTAYVFLIVFTFDSYRLRIVKSVSPMPSKVVCETLVTKLYGPNNLHMVGGEYLGYECIEVNVRAPSPDDAGRSNG